MEFNEKHNLILMTIKGIFGVIFDKFFKNSGKTSKNFWEL